MEKPNYQNEMFTMAPGKVVEVPNHAGYFVGPNNEVYSCKTSKLKILKPYYGKYKDGRTGRARVTLVNDNSEKTRWDVEKLARFVLGEQEYCHRKNKKMIVEQALDMGDMF